MSSWATAEGDSKLAGALQELQGLHLLARVAHGGQAVYASREEVAAACLFYLCRNHPFVDGNKRVALGSCIAFLRLNGLSPAPDGPDWEALTLDVASSQLDRDQTTARLKELVRPAPQR